MLKPQSRTGEDCVSPTTALVPAIVPERPALRVGLLIDSYDVPAWFFAMVEEIHQMPCCDLVLVVTNAAASTTVSVPKPWYRKIVDNRGRLAGLFMGRGLQMVYDRLVDRLPVVPDAFETRSLRGLLEGIPELSVIPKQTTWSDRFADSDLEKLRECRIDVLIRGGFRILRGEVLLVARYGVWSFHHGDNQLNRGGPAGFWESLEGWPSTGTVLQVLSEDMDNGVVLARTYTRTDPWSVRQTRNRTYWKALAMVPRALRRLYNDGPTAMLHEPTAEHKIPALYSRPLYRTPSNRELATLVGRKALAKVRHLWTNRRWREQWILAYHYSDELSSVMWRYKRLVPPADRFWADPHAVELNGRHYVFLEEYLYATGRGTIAVLEFDEHGVPGQPRTVLERPYHLSYPFVFFHNGTHYMIPETADHHAIELYRCLQFPDQWVFERTLLQDINAVDATLHQHGGKWWMFVNVVERDGVSPEDELFLYHTDDPINGEWVPHRANPVVSDCRTARPAGRLFEQDGVLYRPSQYSVHRYGYGLNLNRVVQLDEIAYREELVTRATPDWDKSIVGLHSFTKAGRLHVIDALLRRRR